MSPDEILHPSAFLTLCSMEGGPRLARDILIGIRKAFPAYSTSSFYHLAAKLSERGVIRCQDAHRTHAAWNIYRITAKGKKALADTRAFYSKAEAR